MSPAIIVHLEDNRVKGFMFGRDLHDLMNQCRASWSDQICNLASDLILHDPPLKSVTEISPGYWLMVSGDK